MDCTLCKHEQKYISLLLSYSKVFCHSTEKLTSTKCMRQTHTQTALYSQGSRAPDPQIFLCEGKWHTLRNCEE